MIRTFEEYNFFNEEEEKIDLYNIIYHKILNGELLIYYTGKPYYGRYTYRAIKNEGIDGEDHNDVDPYGEEIWNELPEGFQIWRETGLSEGSIITVHFGGKQVIIARKSSFLPYNKKYSDLKKLLNTRYRGNLPSTLGASPYDYKGDQIELAKELGLDESVNEQLIAILGAVPLMLFLTIFASRGLITRKVYKHLIKKANNVDIQVRLLNLNNAAALVHQYDVVPFFMSNKTIDDGRFYYIRIISEERRMDDVDPYGEEEWGEEATEILISQNTRKMLVKNIPMDDYPKLPIASKRIVKLTKGEYRQIVEKITPLIRQ
jgi:hypothetical protein